MLEMHLHALFPTDPQVSTSEKTSDSMTGQVVDPALLPQLGHYGINPWKTCLGFSPFSQSLWVLVPRDAHTDWVAFHLIKSWVGGGSSVEKFPPQQLTIEGERRIAVFLYL